MRAWLALLALLPVLVRAAPAAAQVFHVVQPGDTPTSIAVQYYGEARREAVVRAVNGMSAEGDVELALGEPVLVPERRHRIVAAGDSWAELARVELGAADRAWLLAQVNDTDPEEEPEPGRVIVVPYLMPLSIADGLPATVARYYPDAQLREMARVLRQLNPSLRARVQRGTRIVLPLADLEIVASRRADLATASGHLRGRQDVERQERAAADLARLPDMIAAGSFAEVVELAGRIEGGADLTAAQRLRLLRYLGHAFVALDRADLAEEQFRELLALQPDFQFDQVTTSPAVLEVLDRARRARAGGSRSTVDRR